MRPLCPGCWLQAGSLLGLPSSSSAAVMFAWPP